MWWRRLLRWAAIVLLAAVSVSGVAVLVVARTEAGADAALRIGLGLLHQSFDGRFEVSGIRTRNLLRGVSLYDVTVTDVDGGPALSIDSLTVGYRVGDLVRKRIRIRAADVWGARVLVSKRPGDSRVNLERIFDPDRSPAAQGGRAAQVPEAGRGSGLEVRLSGARIHDAHLIVTVPAGQDPDTTSGVFEATGDGEWLRRVELAALNAEVVDADFVGARFDGERARVRNLEGEVHLFPMPFRITELTGELRRIGSTASVQARSLQIESSRFQGTGTVDWSSERMAFETDLASDRFDPADFAFIEPRLPSGAGHGTLRASSAGGQGVYTFENGELALDGSLVSGSLSLHTGAQIRLEGLDLTMEPLELALLEPWLDEPLPPHLAVRGQMRVDGPLDRLELAGRLTVEALDGRHGPSTVEVSGGVAGTAPFAVHDLSARADPLDFDLVRIVWPAFPVSGRGAVDGRATGRLDRGLELDATLTHVLSTSDTTRVRYRGSVTAAASALPTLAGQAELLGLHLPTLAGVHPFFEAEEVAWGSLNLHGPVDELSVEADLQSSFGQVAGSLEMDATDPAAGARLDAGLVDFDPAPLLDLEADVSLTGQLQADLVRGPDGTLRGTADLTLTSSRYDHWGIDSLLAPISVEDRYATLTSARAVVAGVRLDMSGTVALDSTLAPGSLEVDLLAPSLSEPWQAVTGAPQTLVETPMDSAGTAAGPAEFLPDSTDIEASDASLEGRGRGRIQVRAALPRVDLSGELEVLAAAHELARVDSAWFEIRGQDVVTDTRSVSLDGSLGPSTILGAAFDEAGLRVAYAADSIGFDASLSRADSVRHDFGGTIHLEADQTRLQLDRLDLHTADVDATLVRPARLSWGSRGFSVEDFELVEPNGTDRSLAASGTIPREGMIDFRAHATGIHLEALSALWTRLDTLSGLLEGQVHFHGPVEAPSLSGDVVVRNLAYRATVADSLGANIDYGDRAALVRIAATKDGGIILDGEVRVPLDLTPGSEGPRIPEAPIEGRITARSFPVAPLLSSPGFLEDLAGTLVGDVVIAGTPRSPRLSGRMELEGVSAFFPAFGVRQTAAGTLALEGSRVDVDLSVRSMGIAHITGGVSLEDASDPSFDLRIAADTFQVVNRRDVSGKVSGQATFGGSWASPRLEGALTIRDADLRLDELARSREVADVQQADLYQVVDTTIFIQDRLATPSLVDRSTIGLDLSLGSGTWLRGRTLDTELAGRLRVTHDPGGGYGVSGELTTVRGSYRGFGRTFQVVEGSLLFAGTQGLNPLLNITTVTRIRSSEQALDIFATLEGTAEEPRVTLSSAADSRMAEGELVSYLVFGRPSYQLGSAENAVVSGVTGAASSMALGVVANELGAALGQEIGLFDYFTISAPQEAASYGQESALRSSISSTEVEFGQYLSENLFLAAVFRPLDSANSFAGGRLEWRFRDSATLELFLEDRLARSPSATFGDLGFTLEQSLGMFLAKEWTY